MSAAQTLDEIQIIDVDAHITEPPDLWSSRAPAALKDRLPRVAEQDGRRVWLVDGEEIAPAGAVSVVKKDGSKAVGVEFFNWKIEDVHQASWDMQARRGAPRRDLT
jgi:hypothetical protein